MYFKIFETKLVTSKLETKLKVNIKIIFQDLLGQVQSFLVFNTVYFLIKIIKKNISYHTFLNSNEAFS